MGGLKMKHIRFLFFFGIVIFCLVGFSKVPVSARQESVPIYINDVLCNVDAYLENNTTFVALRSFSQNMELCEVSWNTETNTAQIRSSQSLITASPENNYMTANGRCLFDLSAPAAKNGTLYVPLRLAAKAFGATAEWSYEYHCAKVYTKGIALQSAETYYDADELYWLSKIISAESRGEPLLGQIAVGNVVLNRKNSDTYPSDVYSVIFDNKYGTQFTPVANGTIFDEATPDSVTAAKICLEGFSVSDEILYFINKSRSSSTWMDEFCRFVVKIGKHSFYA